MKFSDLKLTRAEAFSYIVPDHDSFDPELFYYFKFPVIINGIEYDRVKCPSRFEDLANRAEEDETCARSFYASPVCKDCWFCFINRYYDRINQQKLE